MEKDHYEETFNWIDFSLTNVSVNMITLENVFHLEKKTISNVRLVLKKKKTLSLN